MRSAWSCSAPRRAVARCPALRPIWTGLVSSPVLAPDQEQAAEAHAWYALGIHHELKDEYDLAYQAYRRAAERDPANERLVLRMASNLILQRQTEEALRTVEDF